MDIIDDQPPQNHEMFSDSDSQDDASSQVSDVDDEGNLSNTTKRSTATRGFSVQTEEESDGERSPWKLISRTVRTPMSTLGSPQRSTAKTSHDELENPGIDDSGTVEQRAATNSDPKAVFAGHLRDFVSRVDGPMKPALDSFSSHASLKDLGGLGARYQSLTKTHNHAWTLNSSGSSWPALIDFRSLV